jgi:hypothetical protein
MGMRKEKSGQLTALPKEAVVKGNIQGGDTGRCVGSRSRRKDNLGGRLYVTIVGASLFAGISSISGTTMLGGVAQHRLKTRVSSRLN